MEKKVIGETEYCRLVLVKVKRAAGLIVIQSKDNYGPANHFSLRHVMSLTEYKSRDIFIITINNIREVFI